MRPINKNNIFFLLLTFLGIFFYSSLAFPQKLGSVELISKKTGQSCVFTVEIAATEAERNRGLMFREALDPQAGMFFVYPDQKIRIFWMKNTKIALDMIFIDSDNTIVHIHHNAIPMSKADIPSLFPARYVLEVNAGTAKQYGIVKGDKVKIEVPAP
jgi:hypothetical protein